PSLTNETSQNEIDAIMAERMPVYEEIADMIIDTDSLSVFEICDKILMELEKRRLM
ncbi:MAG: shikimate kinase AroK, partial [Candidatus Methanofastidiosum sp.]|nr:shikimate kinase AroK [Methanofastidiosum sp.]